MVRFSGEVVNTQKHGSEVERALQDMPVIALLLRGR
jgi:hypothetical protein